MVFEIEFAAKYQFCSKHVLSPVAQRLFGINLGTFATKTRKFVIMFIYGPKSWQKVNHKVSEKLYLYTYNLSDTFEVRIKYIT